VSAASPEAFAAAVDTYRFGELDLEPGDLELAAATLAESGLLLVGEPHGLRETPGALHALAVALGTRALAFEWSHEEMEAPLQAFVRNGTFELERLWALPPSAELFCGDGRITAGHFALLRRLREEGRLEQVIAFDRLDPEPVPEWQVRDRELAERLLREWDRRLPLIAVAGAFHARLDGDDGGGARSGGTRPAAGDARVRGRPRDAAGADRPRAARRDPGCRSRRLAVGGCRATPRPRRA